MPSFIFKRWSFVFGVFFLGGGFVTFWFFIASSEILRYVRTFGTLLGNIHANEKNKPVTLESKDYVKYLGRLIDSHLNFNYHIEHLKVKINKNVGMLAKLRHFVPRKTLLQI